MRHWSGGTNPIHGLVNPATFIPIAEASRLIIPLGRYVLETACAAAACWPIEHFVAINLSPVQLRDPDIGADVLEVLRRTALPNNRLELEITENTLIENTGRTVSTLNMLRRSGVRVALDDFGTGYSSLGYLRQFPFDKVKIDRSFMSELGGNRR